MPIKTCPFGTTRDGKNVTLYQLTNKNGFRADIIDFGATLVSMHVPDSKGLMRDVVLGFSDVSEYEANTPCFGATIGRNCNRIRDGRFALNGRQYQLEQNDGNNNLHSGRNGFHFRLWDASAVEGEFGQCLRLSLTSADGDQDFPGTLCVEVVYVLSDDGCLHITYHGVSDMDTVVNMTNHSYFNLNGHTSGSIDGHLLCIDAESYSAIDDQLLPTGELKAVDGTAFDFRERKAIGRDLASEEPDLLLGGGYDHNFVLSNTNEFRSIAMLEGEGSGITMEVFTDRPAVQLYTGNFLDGTRRGKESMYYQKRAGVCLETQTFPDAVNHSDFPSSILKAGEKHFTRTTFKFSTK